MRIAICGKSGLVGSKLEAFFHSNSHEVIGIKVRETTPIDAIAQQLQNIDVLINLSGVSILGRWSEAYKERLISSRIESTKKLVEAMAMLREKPSLFLNASAVGIYRSDAQHGDDSTVYANDFLANLCREWEAGAFNAEFHGVRTAVLRFGVIYAKEGGALQKMLPPFRFGLGGKLGSGTQMVSWIHIDDLVRAVDFIMVHPEIHGSVNFCAPYPLSNAKQTRILGKVLKRFTLLSVPAFALKLILGEGAGVMLDSKEVYPTKLLDNGFAFEFPSFEQAMLDLIA